MINVLHITMSLGPGGRREAIKNLLAHTSAEQFQTFLCCLDGFQCSPEFMDALCMNRCFDLRRPGKTFGATLSALRRVIKENRIQVLHVHDGASQVFGCLASLCIKGCRVVYTYHRSDNIDTGTWKDVVRNRLLHCITSKTVTASIARKRYYAARNGIPLDAIQTIYYGLDTDYWCGRNRIPADRRRELGIGADVHIVGTAANLIERKAVCDLIEAFAALPCDLRASVLVIAGDGPQRGMLETLCREREIYDRVFFVGQQSDMQSWYALYDVFVLTSLEEAFGLVYAEALLAGTPVIGSDVGGVPEIIEDGVTGVLVPPRDHGRLSSAISMLLRNPNVGCRMAAAGRERAVRLFSLGRMVKDYETLYQRVCSA